MGNDIGQKNDVIVWRDGGQFFVRGLTPRAMRWIEDNVTDPIYWCGDSILVEHRYVEELVRGMSEDGLVVR